MTLTMATRAQIDRIRELAVDQHMPPTDIGNYFMRTADLNETGALIVAEIAHNLTQGIDVQPDDNDLGQYVDV